MRGATTAKEMEHQGVTRRRGDDSIIATNGGVRPVTGCRWPPRSPRCWRGAVAAVRKHGPLTTPGRPPVAGHQRGAPRMRLPGPARPWKPRPGRDFTPAGFECRRLLY